jgi:Uma2 family endonuclease
MSVSVRHHRHSFRDYLAVEEISTVKHEYLDGEIYAMAGGSVLHAALSAAMLAALHRQLGGRCRVYSSDLRIRVRATGLASYPDMTVVCGAAETDPARRGRRRTGVIPQRPASTARRPGSMIRA